MGFMSVREIMSSDGFMESLFEDARIHREFDDALREGNRSKMLDSIQRVYATHEREIMHRLRDGAWFSGYMLPWNTTFTPIEREAWESIRFRRIVFYPQWPACGFFLDFANPLVKIDIELDGKHWHDKKRDSKRDTILRADGWSVIRVTGAEAMRRYDWPDDEEAEPDEARRWIMHTCDGVLEAVDRVVFRDSSENRDLCIESLLAHGMTEREIIAARRANGFEE